MNTDLPVRAVIIFLLLSPMEIVKIVGSPKRTYPANVLAEGLALKYMRISQFVRNWLI
jgi:hypothetical protein